MVNKWVSNAISDVQQHKWPCISGSAREEDVLPVSIIRLVQSLLMQALQFLSLDEGRYSAKELLYGPKKCCNALLQTSKKG